ncbi:MAG TPA: metallophosphoesterase [Pseudonocardia sp.]|nr:metallophosphoesterase [Pseudonocardia sp.]
MAGGPVHTLIQITDLHIGPEGGTARNPVDTFAVLDRALRAVDEADLRPTAVLFTGDLAEHGTGAEYRRLRGLVDPALARLGTRPVYVAGNHDDRAALREHLLGQPPGTAPLDQVSWFGNLRVIALDSTVPGYGYGLVCPPQLAWLRAELATPAPDGTVLALHHPPLPSPVPLSSAIELQNREALAEVLTGSDVRMVLAGHTHVVSAGALAGIPVWTGGPIATMFDGLIEDGALRGLASPSVSRIDLFADSVIATNVPFDAAALINVPAEVMQPQIAALRAQLPAAPRG